MNELISEKKIRVADCDSKYHCESVNLAERLGVEIIDHIPENELVLVYTENGLALEGDGMRYIGDFRRMVQRIRPQNLNGELLVKCAKIKGEPGPLTVVDATAGMGEDSFLLAAAGFNVIMYERDPVIAELLSDTLKRYEDDPEVKDIVLRMDLRKEDSIPSLPSLSPSPDAVLLDPMFPERRKSGLIKKKFQLIHGLEEPCKDEKELLEAALSAHPKKIIIKRPLKGPFLAGIKPSYSINGKAIRYDCIVPSNSR